MVIHDLVVMIKTIRSIIKFLTTNYIVQVAMLITTKILKNWYKLKVKRFKKICKIIYLHIKIKYNLFYVSKFFISFSLSNVLIRIFNRE